MTPAEAARHKYRCPSCKHPLEEVRGTYYCPKCGHGRPTRPEGCPLCLRAMRWTGWGWRCQTHGEFKPKELEVEP